MGFPLPVPSPFPRCPQHGKAPWEQLLEGGTVGCAREVTSLLGGCNNPLLCVGHIGCPQYWYKGPPEDKMRKMCLLGPGAQVLGPEQRVVHRAGPFGSRGRAVSNPVVHPDGGTS